MLIATLIAAGRLDDRLLAAALERVPGARFHAWLDEGDAADLAVPDVAQARAALEGWEECDVVVQPSEHRLKRLLVADMDSTMIGQECIDELADYRRDQARGRGDHRAGDARRARFRRRAGRARRSARGPRGFASSADAWRSASGRPPAPRRWCGR